MRSPAEFIGHTRSIMAQRVETQRRNTPASFQAIKPRGLVSKIIGRAFIGAAILGSLLELARHYELVRLGPDKGHLLPLIIYAVAGFIGWYLENTTQAKDATGVIVNAGVSFVIAARGGRRSTDPIVAVPVSAEQASPEKPTDRRRRTEDGE